jgi:hypothetical protein
MEKPETHGTQEEEKQNKDTTQYVLDTTIHKHTQDMNPPIDFLSFI